MSNFPTYPEDYLQQSKQPLMYGVCSFLMITEITAIILRFLSKRVGGLRWGIDDLYLLLGLLLNIAIASCVIDAKHGGVGLHEARVLQIDPAMLSTWGHMIIIIPILYLAAVVPAKLVLLHLYLSIFIQKPFRWTCYGVAAVVLMNWIASTIAALLSCHPLSYYWTQEGRCFNINQFFRWGTFCNILTDLVMLILPIPVVLKLRLSLRLRLGILVAFLLGSLGMITSILRFYEFYITNAEVDGTWTGATLDIWSTVEPSIYLITACLPSYRPLVLCFRKKDQGSMPSNFGETGSSQRGLHSGSSPAYKVQTAGRFKRVGSYIDMEEDVIGLVEVGSPHSKHEPGKIMVDRAFEVH